MENKTKWTQEEKEQLLELVKANKKSNGGGINWDAVGQELPYSTKECEIEFNNMRRRDATVENDEILSERTNHEWTSAEVEKLRLMADEYGKNWELITRNGFPELTPQKLKNKYATLERQDDTAKNEDNDVVFKQSFMPKNSFSPSRSRDEKGEQNDKEQMLEEEKFEIPEVKPSVLSNIAALPKIEIPTQEVKDQVTMAAFAQPVINFTEMQTEEEPGATLLKDINEISAIDSARLFILDSTRQ